MLTEEDPIVAGEVLDRGGCCAFCGSPIQYRYRLEWNIRHWWRCLPDWLSNGFALPLLLLIYVDQWCPRRLEPNCDLVASTHDRWLWREEWDPVAPWWCRLIWWSHHARTRVRIWRWRLFLLFDGDSSTDEDD
jgi:hypothetical protein